MTYGVGQGKGLSEFKIEKIRKLNKEGLRVSVIAKRLGITVVTVYKYLKI